MNTQINKTLIGAFLVSLCLSNAAVAGGLKDLASNSKAGSKVSRVAKGAANKAPDPQEVLERLNEAVSAMPRPKEILGDAKGVIDETIGTAVEQIKDLQADVNRFKGRDCGGRTDCGILRERLIGIYRGLRGITDTLPGYQFMAFADAHTTDPLEQMIERVPPIALYGLDAVFGNLDTLENAEQLSGWVDQLRFYAVVPVEEDIYYRLPVGECATLEASIRSDNWLFDQLSTTLGQINTVSDIGAQVMPKDIVINAWFGGSIPNPALPVFVFMSKLSQDFIELIEAEMKTRGETVKRCRAQAFATGVNEKLDALLKN